MDLVRSLVSKKKRRWENDGFNLDLTYITDSILAMGFPSEGTEGLFRNPLGEVQRFLRERHGESFHVYNLCVERSYKADKFAGRVSVFPFADHNAPTLTMIREFCQHVDEWLKASPKNVAAVHCKAGKGRTGTMICCYLLYCGALKRADDVLEFYGVRRTHNGRGVTIPSQRRYVAYFAETLHPSWDLARERLQWSLRRVFISHVPRNEHGESIEATWKPLIGVTRKDKTLLYVGAGSQSESLVPTFQCDGLVVNGDIKFELFNGKSTKRILWFWLNTAFIAPGHCSLTLHKHEIDGICKDKEHKILPSDFTITIFFERVAGRARSNQGSRAPPPAASILEMRSPSPSPTSTAPTKRAMRISEPSTFIASPASTNARADASPSKFVVEPPPPSFKEPLGTSTASSPPNPTSSIPVPSLSTSDFASLHRGISESFGASSQMSSNISLSANGTEGEKLDKPMICEVCGLSLVNNTETVNTAGKTVHWACASCSVCSEPLANRASCTVADTTTIHAALICSNCDTFWVRCNHCKRPLQDGNRHIEIPNLGKRCYACFCCSICRLQFGKTDEDDDDDDTDAYDICNGALICRSHSHASRKIFTEKSSRPRSARVGNNASSTGLASMPSNTSGAPVMAQNGSLETKPSNQPPTISTNTLETKKIERPTSKNLPHSNKLSLRRIRGQAVEMPRCGLCHGLIDVNCESAFVEQWGKSFHIDHFKCTTCASVILSGELYHIVGDSAHCNDCFSKSSTCYKCQLPVLGQLIQVGPNLYVHPECFQCNACQTTIQGPFCEIGSQTFCMACFKEGKHATQTQTSEEGLSGS